MAAKNIRMSRATQLKFNDDIKLFLSNWSDFQSACEKLSEIRRSQFNNHVFDFFSPDSELDVDGLSKMLFNAVRTKLSGLLNFAPIKKVSEELLRVYQGCLSDEELGSESRFREDMNHVLSEWSQLQSILSMSSEETTHQLQFDLFFHFFRNDEPTVDGLAKTIHRTICDKLESLVEFTSCEKAAAQFFVVYRNRLETK